MYYGYLETSPKSCQNFLVNVGFLSETMDVGMTCNLNILSMKTWATQKGVNGWSTTTMITNLLLSWGNPTIKSMEMSIHIYFGSGSGCNSLNSFIGCMKSKVTC
jgi:hypothetical protein